MWLTGRWDHLAHKNSQAWIWTQDFQRSKWAPLPLCHTATKNIFIITIKQLAIPRIAPVSSRFEFDRKKEKKTRNSTSVSYYSASLTFLCYCPRWEPCAFGRNVESWRLDITYITCLWKFKLWTSKMKKEDWNYTKLIVANLIRL